MHKSSGLPKAPPHCLRLLSQSFPLQPGCPVPRFFALLSWNSFWASFPFFLGTSCLRLLKSKLWPLVWPWVVFLLPALEKPQTEFQSSVHLSLLHASSNSRPLLPEHTIKTVPWPTCYMSAVPQQSWGELCEILDWNSDKCSGCRLLAVFESFLHPCTLRGTSSTPVSLCHLNRGSGPSASGLPRATHAWTHLHGVMSVCQDRAPSNCYC